MPKVGKLDLETEEEKRKRIPNKVFVYLLLFIPISYVIGYFFLAIYTHFKYKNILADTKAKGEPTSLADYEFPEVPNELNGAVYVKSAIDHAYVESDDFIDTYERKYGYVSFSSDFKVKHLKESPEKLQTIKDWIAANKLTLELINKATQCSKSDFRFEYKNKNLWESNYFYMSSNCHIKDLLKYETYLSIIENNKPKAIDEFNELVNYGLLWKNELTWENHADINQVFYTALITLRAMIDGFDFTVDEINAFSINLQRIFNTLNIKETLIQERCFYLDYISLIKDDPMFIFEFECSDQYKLLPIYAVKLDMLKTIKILGLLIEMADKSYQEIEGELSKLMIDTRETTISWEFSEHSDMIRIFRSHFDDTALHRIVQTTLAIKKFEIIYNRVPEKLEELIEAGLIDEIPSSPFTNQQLIYEPENGKYRLFCPGSNGVYFKDICGCGDDYDLSNRDIIEWKYEDD